MTDKVQKIREEVVRIHNLLPVVDGDNIFVNYADRICTTLEMYIDSLQEEPLSEELEEAVNAYIGYAPEVDESSSTYGKRQAFKAGAKWGKNQAMAEIQAQSMALAYGCPEESVSEDLEAAIECCSGNKGSGARVRTGFIMGAIWQNEHLWKPADGDDLPEYDREVIAILDYDFGHYKVVYAHRPNPNGWDGTNIDTGKKEHFEPENYDKGGWNQPHVLYWLDTRLPYEEYKIDK